MTQFEDVLETILEEYARRDSEGEFDTWEETDAFVKEKTEVLLAYVKEEPVSEDLEEALAREWQGYNDRGAATVDALEDNSQELAFAKGFYRGAKWKKQKDNQFFASKTIGTLDNAYEKGRHDALEEMKKSKQC